MKKRKYLFMMFTATIGLMFGLFAGTVNLADVTGATTIADGTTIKGTLGGNHKISIAAGAKVTLNGVTITTSGSRAGLTCLGNATITLKGNNVVNGGTSDYPGIFVPSGKKLTIKGSGSLEVCGEGDAAGIGSGSASTVKNGGNIVVNGGVITAHGGSSGPGIGAAANATCGDITINGGTINAYGWGTSPGIGADTSGTCGKISFGAGIAKVVAQVDDTIQPIGSNSGSTSGAVVLDDGLTDSGVVTVHPSSQVIGGHDYNKRTIASTLGGLTGSKTFQDGDIISGELTGNYKISIAHGAYVTLRDVTIPANSNALRPGITCLGHATIILEGDNYVEGSGAAYPGIFVPKTYDLTIRGRGALTAIGSNDAAGIGGAYAYGVNIMHTSSPYQQGCGGIYIESGIVTAKGGIYSAGIGGGRDTECDGGVFLWGGLIRAEGDRPIGNGKEFSDNCYVDVDSRMVSETPESNVRIVKWRGNLANIRAKHHAVAADGTVITGTLEHSRELKIAIDAGATVTLSNATIDCTSGSDTPWAGLTCLGSATIVLKGTNTVKTFNLSHPGIFVPDGKTLTIRGDGSLAASGLDTGSGAGIGGGSSLDCGNIVIDGGIITAHAGYYAAGIGGGSRGKCGKITINGGYVSANCYCGNTRSNVPIGAGDRGTVGTIAIASNMVKEDSEILGGSGRKSVVKWNGVLSMLAGDVFVGDNTTISGELPQGNNHKIEILPGATVTLDGASITNGENSVAYPWAGLTCRGDATIVLEGANAVKGFYEDYPGIYVPQGSTLTITGEGALDVWSSGYGAGIGGGYAYSSGSSQQSVPPCGNIVISNGTITATGAGGSAGIGSGRGSTAGSISIYGGTVTAEGKTTGAGIGRGDSGSSGSITIGSHIALVVATSGTSNNAIHDGTVEGGTVASGFSNMSTDYGRVRTICWNGNLTYLSNNSAMADLTEVTVCNGVPISGTLSRPCKVTIAKDARVTLSSATINNSASFSAATPYAGLTCLGDATIILSGTSTIQPFNGDYPCIYVPRGSRLAIEGSGKLEAHNFNTGARGAGIGGGYADDCRDCGRISINGGTVEALSRSQSAAIGGGYQGSCDGVNIGSGITKVSAQIFDADSTASESQAAPLGRGAYGTCASVSISRTVQENYTGMWSRREFVPSPNTDLSTVTGNTTIQNGAIVTGTLNGPYQISIAAGAEVTLSDVTIDSGDYKDNNSYQFAGLTCLGNVTIWLEGTNTVKGFYNCSGLRVLSGYTLTIKSKNGDGVLYAEGGGYSAGIGGGMGSGSNPSQDVCGKIVIDGGHIYATGNSQGAGIGGGTSAACGTVTINGGTVIAVGGSGAAGIGGGIGGNCGTITINSGITKVVATRGSGSPVLPIGRGYNSSNTANPVIASGLRSRTSADGNTRTIDISPDVNLALLGDGNDAVVVQDEALVFGTLGVNRKICIANGATVTLSNVVINGVNDYHYYWAGITCLGDATIILDGTNTVKGFEENWPGIFIPPGYTLTIKDNDRPNSLWGASGFLYASSSRYGTGIGGGWHRNCGNIRIEGGKITATGGYGNAGIGSGYQSACGTITIDVDKVKGGSVVATGGAGAAGIGCGYQSTNGWITIRGKVDYVVATGGQSNSNLLGEGGTPIGLSSNGGSVAGITISGLADAAVDNTGYVTAYSLDLCRVDCDMVLPHGVTVFNFMIGAHKFSIAPDAAVTLRNARISGANDSNTQWAGLTCLGGDTRITLVGSSTVRSFYEDYPGISVPPECTLTIDGEGSLTASCCNANASYGYAAGIGAGYLQDCGSIVIEGGTIEALGGTCAAGIGGTSGDCGDIIIEGGTVTATGGSSAPGIGGGTYQGTTCGTISIGAGISKVVATCGSGSVPPIAGGYVDSSYVAPVVDSSLEDDLGTPTRTIFSRTVVNLADVTEDIVLQNGDIATGTLGGNYKVSIAAGAKVWLRDADINGTGTAYVGAWAGLTCLGDATILLEGENTVRGGDANYPGIFIPEDHTLTIDGDGVLAAISNSGKYSIVYYNGGAGIGGGNEKHCGNIVINGGTITATTGYGGTGIGGGMLARCGSITINGGTVIAHGGEAGIGAGVGGTCGNISIYDGNVRAIATGGSGTGIGSTQMATCENILIAGGTVYAESQYSGSMTSGAGIGAGHNSGSLGNAVTPLGNGTCGNITISGGSVTAIGSSNGAGIGSGGGAGCGTIDIGAGVVSVVATRGYSAAEPIGRGGVSSGTVTVDSSLFDDHGSRTRTITSKPTDPYAAWAGENGVSGDWDYVDANGVANVFRYAFDDVNFDGIVITGFETDGNGTSTVTTLPVVNGEGFIFTVVASDDVEGTENVETYPLDLSGTTIIEETPANTRFFRVWVQRVKAE